jgi:hypothetical protein
MRVLVYLVFVATILTSCAPTNYETKDIYGKWVGETMGLTMKEGGSCVMTLAGEKMPGEITWRAAMGNTLEFTQNGKVIMSNVTVKGIKDDVLTIELRPMMSGKDRTTIIHSMKRAE